MLVGEVVTILLVELGQNIVLDLPNANNSRLSIVKRRRRHELGHNLITFGTFQWNGFQAECCRCRG